MYRAGHLGMALIWSLPVLIAGYFVSGGVTLFLLSTVTVSLASLPDWDQRIPGIAHRGFTHTIWFALLISGITTVGTAILWNRIGIAVLDQEGYPDLLRETAGLDPLIASMLVGGVVLLTLCSHIVADALTVGSGKYGVQPLWPVSREELRFGYCKADSPLWNYGLLSLGGLLYAGFLIALTTG